jgi:hypothetical protein
VDEFKPLGGGGAEEEAEAGEGDADDEQLQQGGGRGARLRGWAREEGGDARAGAQGRGLHSSTFQLNVSTFCGIRWVHDFPPVC